MLGYDAEPLPDDLSQWIKLVDECDRYRVEHDIRELLMYGNEHFEGVYAMRCRNGDVVRLLFRGIVFHRPRIEGGDAVRILGTAADVTGVV